MTLMPLDPDSTAIFLDVDGTLLDIVNDPASVVADVNLTTLLRSIEARLSGALALVSGRTLEEIDRIFAPAQFTAAGAHGAQTRMPDGQLDTSLADPLPRSATAVLGGFAARHPGLLVEIKDAGAALHYRQAPECETEARELVTSLLTNLGEEYRLIDGKMVLEIAPRRRDKGEAILRLMSDPVFTRRPPVFLGDDVTDEDGFAAVNGLNGISVRVGEAKATAALHSLPDTGSVRNWLESVFAEPQSA